MPERPKNLPILKTGWKWVRVSRSKTWELHHLGQFEPVLSYTDEYLADSMHGEEYIKTACRAYGAIE